jgi:two-component system, OmpR family, sensor histidine kinase KdpD
VPIAVVWGRAYAIPVSVASMLAFNFFFLPPVHTLTLADRENWFALAVYLVTAVVVSDLAARALPGVDVRIVADPTRRKELER